VDTNHGWCIKYITSYPATSGDLPVQGGSVNWKLVCPAMSALLNSQLVQEVVLASYSGVYVDEYQDCTLDQHEFIVTLAKLVPVRVLGDPLQGVFRFAGEPPAWDSVVEREFPNVATLTKPWRWDRPEANSQLGEWLTEARRVLESGRVLRLDDDRVRFIQTPSNVDWGDKAQESCFDFSQGNGTTAALLKWPSDYQKLGRITGGLFQCVEPIEAKDGARLLRALEESEPEDRLDLLLSFLSSIASGSNEALACVKQLLCHDSLPTRFSDALMSAVATARDDAGLAMPGIAAEFLESAGRSPEVKVFRWELLRAVIDTLLDADATGYVDLVALLRRRRSLTSHIGRRLSRRVAGSTLLLKGMEFDHAIVVNTGCFSIHDLYVALTRGAKSLTVLSTTPEIHSSTLSNK